jgi:phosphate starvation-inducible PhoH-like protein
MQNTLDTIIDVSMDGQSLSGKSIHTKKPLVGGKTLSKNRRTAAKSTPHSRSSRQYQHDDQQSTNVVKLSNRNYKKVEMIPRNTAQETYVDQLFDDSKRIVFAIGPAGTGKSYLGVLRAIKALKEGEVEKLIIVRPAVGAEGENHGFLPGDLNQKLSPWLQPLIDIFEEYYGKLGFQGMVDDGTIEFASLMYLRGRSFKNALIILDEAQNSLPAQMKLLLTRLGENTRAFVTGDLDQTDHRKENGLSDFIKRLKQNNSDVIGISEFERKHIERDPIVSEVLRIYGE